MSFFEYVTAKQVMARWNVEPFELFQVVKKGLDPYLGIGGGLGYQKSTIATMLDFNDPDVAHDHMTKEINGRMPTFFFKTKDIEAFEIEHPELLNGDSLTGKDARDLGRLRQKEKRMDAIAKAAFEAGLWAKGKTDITKPGLLKKLKPFGLPPSVIEKEIWPIIPEKHKKGPGRPKKS